MSAVELPAVETPLLGDEWREYAACRGRLELFFGKVAERPQARARREAKANKLCDACVVRQPCRQFARENREYGFWGGENEEDRYLAGFPVTAAIGVRVRLAREEAAG
jgi:WhiB family redox-sensing transcriptional regulator